MSGEETATEVDRCVIWDCIWKHGPMSVRELSEHVNATKPRIDTLVNHEWFKLYYGMIYIANSHGTRQLPRVG